jgi:hypothetical protein
LKPTSWVIWEKEAKDFDSILTQFLRNAQLLLWDNKEDEYHDFTQEIVMFWLTRMASWNMKK